MRSHDNISNYNFIGGEYDFTKKTIIYRGIFLGIWWLLLKQLQKPMLVDELWECYKEFYSNGKYSVRFSFDQFIMALDYLYIIGAIKKDERGKISYEIN